ncbi:hypothetical protein D4764_19G0008880 [Takifugu flavidus]|uniref:Chromogranin B n=1 Tax=Takifugu flavidus TaxID=433684 RepID=A0A5C6NR21_9TELE|nr:hypothetical protein D4764_19G0008880 [Takifugu flavidus]
MSTQSIHQIFLTSLSSGRLSSSRQSAAQLSPDCSERTRVAQQHPRAFFAGSDFHLAEMRRFLVVVVVAALLTENLALPIGKEGQREDVVTRCLVDVLSKALSKPDSQLDPECKDILLAGVKHAPLDKKSARTVTHGEVVNGQPETPEANGADVKDIEALLKSVEGKRETPEDERSQESWSLGDDKGHENGEEEPRQKRSTSWRPKYSSRKNKRGEEEEDNERSQESWDLDEKRSEEEEGEREKRKDKRGWRPGRYHQRRHKRDEESDDERSQESWSLGDDKGHENGEEEPRQKRSTSWRPKYSSRKNKRGEEEEDNERSQESWDLDEKRSEEEEEGEREKRKWRPGRYHQTRHRRDESDDERSQEYWDFDNGRDKRKWRPGRYHQTRHKRDEELPEEPREENNEERSQESWDFDNGRDKRGWRPGRYHQRRHKRDEEFSDDSDYERSQEYWDFDTGYDKRNWRPGRYHQRRHRRDEEVTNEEPDNERSQESWSLDKRNGKDEYHHGNKYHSHGGGSLEEDAEQGGDSEEYEEQVQGRNEALRYLSEKRNPWIYRGYYHPTWFKREQDNATPNKEKELETLAAMDIELQKIAAKLHDNGT